jgi:hypothetical protein
MKLWFEFIGQKARDAIVPLQMEVNRHDASYWNQRGALVNDTPADAAKMLIQISPWIVAVFELVSGNSCQQVLTFGDDHTILGHSTNMDRGNTHGTTTVATVAEHIEENRTVGTELDCTTFTRSSQINRLDFFCCFFF